MQYPLAKSNGASESQDCGPLHGLKVLDLSRILAGPWATQLLGDYGAEILKVERPGVGDDTRNWGPPWLGGESQPETRDAAYFLSTNRNKRSITINIAHPEGARIVRRLAATCDVLVENFKVGTMARYGLGYDDLAQDNRALIYCSVSAYGQTGSRADKPGYDAMIQASAGLMSITGEPDDQGGVPQKVGVAIADIMAGMYATTAILAALACRERTKEGQHLDVPLYDSQISWLANQNMNYLIGGSVPKRRGSGHPNIVPYQTFAAADGYITLAVGNDRQFIDCMQCIGLGSLATDPRFQSNADRVNNRAKLVQLMATKFGERSCAYWLKNLTACGVPVGPINSIDEVLGNEYASERQLVRSVQHTAAGEIPTVANPVGFSKTPVEYRLAPPLLGEHTEQVLATELGYSAEEIDVLKKSGAI